MLTACLRCLPRSEGAAGALWQLSLLGLFSIGAISPPLPSLGICLAVAALAHGVHFTVVNLATTTRFTRVC